MIARSLKRSSARWYSQLHEEEDYFRAGGGLSVVSPRRRFEATGLEVSSASHWRENRLLHLALEVEIYL